MRGEIAVAGVVGEDEKNVWLGRERDRRRLGDIKDEKKRDNQSWKHHWKKFVINKLRGELVDSDAQFWGF